MECGGEEGQVDICWPHVETVLRWGQFTICPFYYWDLTLFTRLRAHSEEQ